MRSMLAIICPPAAVAAFGTRSQAVANAGLTLCLFVPGVLHALSVVDQYNVERRYEAVMRAMAESAV